MLTISVCISSAAREQIGAGFTNGYSLEALRQLISIGVKGSGGGEGWLVMEGRAHLGNGHSRSRSLLPPLVLVFLPSVARSATNLPLPTGRWAMKSSELFSREY